MKNLLSLLLLIQFISCMSVIETSDPYKQECQIIRDEQEVQTKTRAALANTLDYENYPYTMEEDSLFICSIGKVVDNIDDFLTYYLVNDEFIYLKENLLSWRNMQTTRLMGTLLDENKQKIYINYIPQAGNEDEFFEEAVSVWNNVPDCNIYFSTTPIAGFSEATLTISENNPYGQTTGLDYIYMSANGEPNTDAWINYGEQYTAFGDDMRVYTFMHVLGHIIGLENEDTSTNHIDGTDSYDSESIMMSYSTLKNYYFRDWTGFSARDKANWAKIYPLKPKTISLQASASSLYNNSTYTFQATYETYGNKEISNVTYDFEVIAQDGNDEYVINEDQSAKCTINFSKAGTYTVKVTIYGGENNTYRGELSKMFTIKQKQVNSIKYPTSIELEETVYISWDYSTTSFSGNYVNCTQKEILFDGDNSPNITIERVSDTKFAVTLHEYGHYVVTAKLKTESGQELSKEFHFEKYYQPKFQMSDPLNLCEDDLYQYIPATLKYEGKLGTVTDDVNYFVTFNDVDSLLSHRIVGLLKTNYIKNTDINYAATIADDSRRVDHALVYTKVDTFRVNAGLTARQTLPTHHIYRLATLEEITKFAGYYTWSYLSDKCYVK